ncbi:YfiR family protein [Piscinibacter sp. HJYY11]|uniref:YfiR family protein n=1 Tax=Piscinibacter sp. HJYY11 TaxID=2801333 RepID=UPI00191F7D20|nr:YfiR family protein [Piscinibacter sp. HJYY11]MBL0727269.1 YfiR family protein [Piscinibacter sp. HJYY11]
MSRCHALVWALLLLVAGLSATPAPAQHELTEEVRVKAAYLHKFPSFVEWPAAALPSDGAPIVIGIASADAIFRELERISKGRHVAGRLVEARRVDGIRGLAGLHVLFIGREMGSEASLYLKAAQALPILTVAEHEPIERLVILNFLDRGGTVRFSASLPAAEKAGLTLSSRLLAVADHVHGSPRDKK